MKRFFYLMITALAACLAFSCTPEAKQPEAADTLKIVRAESTIMPDGGSCSLEVEASQAVTVTTDKAWSSVSVSGKTITVTAEPNLTNESRYCFLTIKSGAKQLYFSVLQYGEVLDGLDALGDITAPAEGRTNTYPVLANIQVSFDVDQAWIHPSIEDGKLIIVVDPNDEPRTRTGQLSYTAGSQSGTLNVMQYPGIRRPDNWVLTEGTPSYAYPRFQTSATLSAGAEDMYLLFLVPKSEVSGSVQDYVFDKLAVDARNEILDKVEANPGTSFADYLLTGSEPYLFEDIKVGESYLVAVGFADNSYVSGLYQYKLITVDDIRPPYYKWTGKWNLSGKNIEGAAYTETFEIFIDETDVDADGNQLEGYLLVKGLCSKNAAAAGVTPEMDVDGVYVIYDKASGAITFYGQNCEKTFTSASQGAGSRLQLISMYVKAGATSYTNVTGGKFLTAKMNEDGNTTTLTALDRSAGLPYRAFRMRLLNAAGSAYTIGGNASTIAIDDNLTITRAE